MEAISRCQAKPRIDLKEKPFGRLIAKKIAGRNKSGNILWECLCVCGNKVLVCGGDLRNGHTQSCGCLKKEKATKHGMVGTATYRVWNSMLQRCNNEKNTHYEYYGGRGITVCNSWFKFEDFFKDMGIKPEGLTLERIQNDLGYAKENCKWATPQEQSRNQRLKKNNTTGVSGVRWNKQRNKYQVTIKVNYKSIYIGRYNALEQAIRARQQAEQKYW